MTTTDLDNTETNTETTIAATTIATLAMDSFVIVSNISLVCLLYKKLSENSVKMMTKLQDLKMYLRLSF